MHTRVVSTTHHVDETLLEKLKAPLDILGSEIKSSLIKTKEDGTKVIVPYAPSADSDYPQLLDRELDAARNLIKEPSFGKSLSYAVIGIVAVILFIGDWLGLSGSDWFVAYGLLLLGAVVNYADTSFDKSKKQKALGQIRKIIMDDYISRPQ